MERKIKEIVERISKLYPTNYITVDYTYKCFKNTLHEKAYRVYVQDHRFKNGTTFSNECDSLEGLIHHLNYEFDQFKEWKPITQTAKGKRELTLFENTNEITKTSKVPSKTS
jgi:hypothetical protein